MPRGRELTDEERAVINALHNEGKSSRSIALVLNRDHSGISKYLKKRDEEKKPRPGAPRKLNEAQLRLLYRTASNRVISAPQLKAELQLNVSTKTILTYLHRNPNFQRRTKEKNQMLTLVELIIAFVSKYIVLKGTYNFHNLRILDIQSTRF